MNKLFKLFSSIIFICCFTLANGQLYDLNRYADDNGLSSRIVRTSYQDSNGFLWVGGNNGLFKFDGQKFRTFYNALKDTSGLRDNTVTTIVETSDRKIWVGTKKGLHYIEGDSIMHFPLLSNPKC